MVTRSGEAVIAQSPPWYCDDHLNPLYATPTAYSSNSASRSAAGSPVQAPAHVPAKLLAAALSELELSFRPMFGGIMGYARGRPFASLSSVGLAIKLTGADHAAALALPGACPLRYKPDSPHSRSCVLMPDRVLEDPAQLAA